MGLTGTAASTSSKLLYRFHPRFFFVHLESAGFDVDRIVTGHIHVAAHTSVQDHDIPVLVTGSTIPISSYEKESGPSTWLLTATSSGIDLERQPE